MVSCLHRSDYKCMCINPSPVCLNRLGTDIHREFSPLHKVGFVPIGAPVAILSLNPRRHILDVVVVIFLLYNYCVIENKKFLIKF